MKTQATKNDGLALTAPEKQITETLDKLKDSGLACSIMQSSFEKAFTVARCIKAIRAALTPEAMAPIMEMQGTPLGFKTDKDKDGGYPLNVVREALIEAAMAGVVPCGNQFNIIAGRMYLTKEGFTYLLRQVPDLRYTINQGVPVMVKAGATVRTEILWSTDLTGVTPANKKILEIPVRVNNGMGADAILGKADRKAKCWLFNHVTGNTLSDGEVDDAGMRATSSRVVDSNPFAAKTPQEPQQGVHEPLGDNLPGLEPETAYTGAQEAYRD